MLIDGTPVNCCQFHLLPVSFTAHVACATKPSSASVGDGFYSTEKRLVRENQYCYSS